MEEKYLPELMAEKDSLDPSFTHALRLVNQGRGARRPAAVGDPGAAGQGAGDREGRDRRARRERGAGWPSPLGRLEGTQVATWGRSGRDLGAYRTPGERRGVCAHWGDSGRKEAEAFG